MTTIDSPAAARRRLRLALRRAREASHLTQGEVAESLEWSISKVNRIENGEVTISATDLRAVLNLLGITDRDMISELTRDARTARKRGWWDDPQLKPHLTPALVQLIQFESDATKVRSFQATLVPGIFQTPEYTNAVLEFWKGLPPDTKARRTQVRAKRSEAMLSRTDLTFLAILDESVLLRHVGGPAVMAAQLRYLLQVGQHPNITIRVVPLAEGAPLCQAGSFTILNLEDDGSGILYQESGLNDDRLRSIREGDSYGHIFEQMWEVAFTHDESARLIDAHAAAMITTIDRANRTQTRPEPGAGLRDK